MATAEFKKAAGILGGLWERVREQPDAFLDRRIIEAEGLDAAARDFVAGMTDRYAVSLFEQLFIPKPWVSLRICDRAQRLRAQASAERRAPSPSIVEPSPEPRAPSPEPRAPSRPDSEL